MEDAPHAFFTALTISKTIPIALFNLGVVLMQRGYDDAGREALGRVVKRFM